MRLNSGDVISFEPPRTFKIYRVRAGSSSGPPPSARTDPEKVMSINFSGRLIPADGETLIGLLLGIGGHTAERHVVRGVPYYTIK